MAKLGLKYPVYATASETDSAISYSGGAVLAKAIAANITITTNDVFMYADDAIRESDHSFQNGTISMEIDDFANAAQVALLGYTEGSTIDASLGTKELIASGTDVSPFVGFGFYGRKLVANVPKWRAVWLKKVQFREPNDEMQTKGQNTEFRSTTIEGTIMVAADGRWKEEATFDTEAEAIAYLNTKSGISTDPSNDLTALSFSNGTLSPSFSATKYAYSCAVTDDTAITATFSAGTTKVYVDGTYLEDLATTVQGSSINMDAGDNKVVEIVVQESGKSVKTYTIVIQRAA
jgi:phi13 family phage major tail protein